MKRIIFLLLSITLFLVGCTPQMANPPAKEEKEPDLDEKYNVKELISDKNFNDGMTVLSQKDHKNGDRSKLWSNHKYIALLMVETSSKELFLLPSLYHKKSKISGM